MMNANVFCHLSYRKEKGVKSVKHTRIAVVTYDDQEAVLIQKNLIYKNIYFSKVIKLSYRQKSNGSIFFSLYIIQCFFCLFVFVCFLSWTLNKITKISVNRICLPQEIFLFCIKS